MAVAFKNQKYKVTFIIYLMYVTFKSDQMPSFTLEGDRIGMAASPSQFEAVAQV